MCSSDLDLDAGRFGVAGGIGGDQQQLAAIVQDEQLMARTQGGSHGVEASLRPNLPAGGAFHADEILRRTESVKMSVEQDRGGEVDLQLGIWRARCLSAQNLPSVAPPSPWA